MKKIYIVMLIFAGFFIVFIAALAWMGAQLPKRTASNPLEIADGLNDFVFAEANETSLEYSLTPVDITKVEVTNDGANLLVAITTAEALPAIGPAYPDCYVCVVNVMADRDGDKFASADITVDDLGWSFFVTPQTEDSEKVTYSAEGNTVTFTFPLDMEEWKGTPETMSFYIMSGCENNGRILDLIPDQEWGDFQYQDYDIWQD